MKRISVVLLVVWMAGLLAGCATPEARIKENPELFESFPEDVRANVRSGKVDIGYTKDMVYIALGKPDREYIRKTKDGVAQVWSYTETYTTRERQRVKDEFRVRDSSGRVRTVKDSVWVDVNRDHEYEALRVEFKGDWVVAVERVDAKP